MKTTLSFRGVPAAALLLAGLGMCVPALADVKTKPEEKRSRKDKPAELIPEVRDGAAGFVAGQSTLVELVASVGTLRPVEFLIRQQPEHGTLSGLRLHPRETNKALVTYTHRGGDAPLADRFTFAARVDGGPVSSAATVTLTGRRFEPRLEVVDYYPIDKVFLGSEGIVRFALRNRGAAAFAGDISWEAPWEGPPRIELKPGEIGKYVVRFRSDKPGIYRQEKVFQEGVAESKLSLYAQCVRSLTVSPGQLALAAAASGGREGEIILSNGRMEPIRVEVSPPARLQGGGIIEVPGGGKSRVLLGLSPQDVAAFHGEVRVSSSQGVEVVTVEAAAKPAELRIVSPGGASIDLGGLSQGKEGRAEVRIRNSGGTTAVIQAAPAPPLTVKPAGEAVRLEPGGEAVFQVALRGEQPGPLGADLGFSGATGIPPVRVHMEVLPADAAPVPPVMAAAAPQPAASAAPAAGSASGSVMRQALLAYLSANGLPLPKEKINPFLQQVTEVYLKERTRDSVTISWKKPSLAPSSWVIETSTMAQVAEGAGLVKVWNPVRNWKIVEGDPGRVTVRLESLRPGTQMELRILGSDSDGKMSEPSPAFSVYTAMPWRAPSWIWRFLALVGLGAAGLALHRIRRGDWTWGQKRGGKARAAA